MVNNVVVYVDDLLVHSVTFEEHLAVLKNMHERIARDGWKLHPGKTSCVVASTGFLGHRVGAGFLSQDQAKVVAIRLGGFDRVANLDEATIGKTYARMSSNCGGEGAL